MLDQRQVDQYKALGFLVLRGFLQPEEMRAIEKEVMDTMQDQYRDQPFDGTKRHFVTMLGSNQPFMRSLTEGDRFVKAAEQLCGTNDFFVLQTDANRYVGDTGWHPDGNGELVGAKFVFYLDTVGASNGALRVMPGSHREPLHSEIKHFLSTHNVGIDEMPSYICESNPGDVVVFNFPIWHASSGGSSDRRMCTIEYVKAPTTPEEADLLARKIRSIEERSAIVFPRADTRFYPPDWVENSSQSPLRARWINRLVELGLVDVDESV